MGFKKSNEEKEKITPLNSKEVFLDRNKSVDERIMAVENLLIIEPFKNIFKMLNEHFREDDLRDHPVIDYIFTYPKELQEDDIPELLKLLKSDNAYLRNIVIGYLREQGEKIENYVRKLLKDPDKDVRIFAVNILQDAGIENAREIIREFIQEEREINPLMTAVECLGEIGSEEDIPLLEKVKERFPNEPFVSFAVDNAIKRLSSG
jgi:hypothetical protein